MRAIVAVVVLGAGLVAPAAAMDAPSRAGFVHSCETQMYMSASACACMADIAAASLDDNAIAYLSLNATDVVRSAALSKSMSATEIASIDKFMSSAPKQCRDGK